MIVDMKKVTVFVTRNSRDEALERLRDLGVLHVENVEATTSESVSRLEEKMRQARSCGRILSEVEAAAQPGEEKSGMEPEQIVEQTLALKNEKLDLREELSEKREQLDWYDTWGRVSQADLDRLESRGVYVRLYRASENQYNELPDDLPIYQVNRAGSSLYLALVTDEEDCELDLTEELPPATPFEKLKTRYQEIEARITEINEELARLSGAADQVDTFLEKLEEKLEFARVKSGMGEEEQISFLAGYCPVDRVEALKEAAGEAGWGYLIKDPEDPREVPTLMSDTFFTRLTDPIYRFMGTLPGYDEFDISTLFLAFFAVFVALIVGDAGYGLIYLGLTALAHKFYSEHVSGETFTLFYILSLSTVAWGLLTGTIFGVEQLQQVPVLRSLIYEPVRSFADGNQALLMFITFVIGGVQLVVGHLLRLWKSLFHLQALAEAGWTLIVGCMLFVAEKLVLGGALVGQAVTYGQLGAVIGGGAFLVLLFENYRPGEFWSGLAFTLGNLPMDVISAFADIVSYIRLFAVGLATVVIMESFNTIALNAAEGVENAVLGVIIAAVILVLGHGLNMILCLMSIVVHGIRLNMLEFSNHVGIQWTGRRYQPFGRKSSSGD